MRGTTSSSFSNPAFASIFVCLGTRLFIRFCLLLALRLFTQLVLLFLTLKLKFVKKESTTFRCFELISLSFFGEFLYLSLNLFLFFSLRVFTFRCGLPFLYIFSLATGARLYLWIYESTSKLHTKTQTRERTSLK